MMRAARGAVARPARGVGRRDAHPRAEFDAATRIPRGLACGAEYWLPRLGARARDAPRIPPTRLRRLSTAARRRRNAGRRALARRPSTASARPTYLEHAYFVAELRLVPPRGAPAREFVLVNDAVTHEVRNHVVFVVGRDGHATARRPAVPGAAGSRSSAPLSAQRPPPSTAPGNMTMARSSRKHAVDRDAQQAERQRQQPDNRP